MYRQLLPAIGLALEEGTDRCPEPGRYYVFQADQCVAAYATLEGAQARYTALRAAAGAAPAHAAAPRPTTAPPLLAGSRRSWVDDQKVCSHCRVAQAPNAFYRCATNADGLHAWCRRCHNADAARAHARARRAAGSKATPRRNATAPLGTHWCPDCADYVPLAAFRARPARRSGVEGYCKTHKTARDTGAQRRKRQQPLSAPTGR